MTDEILKKIDELAYIRHCDNKEHAYVIHALRLAIEQLHELRKSYPEIDGWEISLIERKIAAILGMESFNNKEGEIK